MSGILIKHWDEIETGRVVYTEEDHIPLDILMDVREGRRDPIVFRFFDAHLQSCTDCQTNKRIFMDNQTDPITTVHDSPMRIPEAETEKGKEHLRRWLKMGLNDFQTNYKLAQGEASCEIYDESVLSEFIRVLDAMYEVAGEDAPHIKFVTGPILSIKPGPGPRQKRTILTKLAAHPLFDLYYSRYRQRLHFRIGANVQRLYCESFHDPGDFEGRQSHFVVNGDFKAIGLFADRFNKLLDDPYVQYCSDKSTKRFAYMTNGELRDLDGAVKAEGMKYNELLDTELLEIAEKNNIKYS